MTPFSGHAFHLVFSETWRGRWKVQKMTIADALKRGRLAAGGVSDIPRAPPASKPRQQGKPCLSCKDPEEGLERPLVPNLGKCSAEILQTNTLLLKYGQQ